MSCHTYSFDETFCSDNGHPEALALLADVPVHSPGFGQALLLPFTTKRRLPSALTLTEFGYQPVGIETRDPAATSVVEVDHGDRVAAAVRHVERALVRRKSEAVRIAPDGKSPSHQTEGRRGLEAVDDLFEAVSIDVDRVGVLGGHEEQRSARG